MRKCLFLQYQFNVCKTPVVILGAASFAISLCFSPPDTITFLLMYLIVWLMGIGAYFVGLWRGRKWWLMNGFNNANEKTKRPASPTNGCYQATEETNPYASPME
jgi:hypothetical protein